MLITPNKVILKELKQYDNKLFIKWNNEKSYFEVWRRMLWGDKIITPVVSNIYNPGKGDNKFCPLDRRLIVWLHSADTQRKGLNKNWKWAADRRFKDVDGIARSKIIRQFRDIAAEQYGILNKDMITAVSDGSESDWLKPDVAGVSRSKVSKRSAENAKEYFDDSSRDN